MGRGPIPMRRPKLPFHLAITTRSTFGISPSFLGLSQSSGQVTHVLLTRSRLCPRPKPGSSLHLHVLGTPPAFVLSQDQTLREELQNDPRMSRPTFHKECRGRAHLSGGRTRACPLVGTGPCARLTSRSSRAPCTPGAPERMTGSSILAPPFETLAGRTSDGVEPGHTPRSGNSDRSVRMLLSFQRPSPPLQEGGSFHLGVPRQRCSPLLARTDEYSARSDHGGKACRESAGRPDRPRMVAAPPAKWAPPARTGPGP